MADGKYAFYRFRCKSYSCGKCGPCKIRLVRKRITQLALEHKLQRFLTLTLDPAKIPAGADVSEKIAYLQGVWRKMRVSVSRQLGRALVFVGVMELQGNGNPHLHLLIDSYLPKAWISKAWQAVGGGWATRIEYSDLHRVAAYLAKYVTDESVCNLPPGTRRFSTSRGLAIFARSVGDSACLLLKSPIEQVFNETDAASDLRFETDGEISELISFLAPNLCGLDPITFVRPRLRTAGAQS